MRAFLLSLISLAAFISPASAKDRHKLLSDCPTVEACFEILDSVVPEDRNLAIEDDAQWVAEILERRFGDSARAALIAKSDGDHDGWADFASEILWHWNGWDEADVPLLAKRLERNPRDWATKALAKVGSEDAIKSLVAVLPCSGMAGGAGMQLYNMGGSVLPYLLPALAGHRPSDLADSDGNCRGPQAAEAVISSFGSRALTIAGDWIAVALDPRQPRDQRVAALRGLAAMDGYLGDRSKRLRPIVRNRNGEISNEAYLTLVSAHDPTVARRVAESCQPVAKLFDPFPSRCLQRLADFGANGQVAGDLAISFLSGETEDQLQGIETIGRIGYKPAIPQVEPFLNSKDWRLVVAAVRALGQLDAKESISKIESATRWHWLHEVRSYGRSVVGMMLRNQPTGVPYNNLGGRFDAYFGEYDWVLNNLARCRADAWRLGPELITFSAERDSNALSIELPDGELVATDVGEFGGGLNWKPKVGDESVIVPFNTSSVLPAADGYVALHGLSHMFTDIGFATFVRQTSEGWEAVEIARFPHAARRMQAIGDDRFVANSGGRAILFSLDGIIAELECDRSAMN